MAARRGRPTPTPANSNGTTSPSNRQRIDCSGRTQRNVAARPSASTSARAAGRSPAAGAPPPALPPPCPARGPARTGPVPSCRPAPRARSRARRVHAGSRRVPAPARRRAVLCARRRGRPAATASRSRPRSAAAAWRTTWRRASKPIPAPVSASPTRRCQLLARPVLHAGRDLLGEQLEQQLRHRLSLGRDGRGPRARPRRKPWRARAPGRYRPPAR